MYGHCQNSGNCTEPATHLVQFGGQPRDPMRVCEEHARKHRKPGNTVKKL